jgi:hypothetical protein
LTGKHKRHVSSEETFSMKVGGEISLDNCASTPHNVSRMKKNNNNNTHTREMKKEKGNKNLVKD